MKKTIFAIAGILSFLTAGAQTLEFRYQGQRLDNEATVTIVAEEDFFGEMSCETNPSTAPMDGLVLDCLGGASGTVTAVLQIQDNTLDATTLQWCMGGECTLVGSKTMLTKTFSADEGIQVLFDATNIVNDGELTAKLDVTLDASTQTVYIHFINGDPAGIEKREQRLEKREQWYDLQGRRISGQLSKGIYIYNGKKILK
ncbi:MAG: hypothetical protein J5593_05220 [Bacteroidaceae bacterium]|nr:hypothetical protein [Bacteroidaceae bacterium]